MEILFYKLGYNEKLTFLNKGRCGMWLIWLGALLATAIHFIPFSIVHGKLLLILSIPLAINALVGMFEPGISFYYFGIIDGIIKILFGSILIKTRKTIGE